MNTAMVEGVRQVASTDSAMVVRAPGSLVMHVSPAEARRRIQELQAFVKEAMVEGVDFGIIPGTGSKPSLYKPGAEKLAELYGFSIAYEPVESIKDWDSPFFYFELRCVLVSRRDGVRVGEGLGSCNSREDRYAWRWLDAKKLPAGIDKGTLKQRPGKWGPMYRLPNEDIFSLVNTMQKVAAKRSLVMAVIGVTRSSGLFTQDVEDLPREVFGEVEQERQWEQGAPRGAEAPPAAMPTQHEGVQPNRIAPLLAWFASAQTEEELDTVVAEVVKLQATKAEKAELSPAYKAAKERLAKAFGGFEKGEREPGEDAEEDHRQ